MKIPPAVTNHLMLSVAVISIAQRIARELRVPADASVAELTREAGTNRTYVYEIADRVLAALDGIASARPGRPRSEAAEPDVADAALVANLRLENSVLRFRIEHPDARVPGRGNRHQYSARFRRFVLECLDDWTGSLEHFARCADVPLDTLRDWIQADRAGLSPPIPEPRPPIEVPRDASDLVHKIASRFAGWEGTTKAFLSFAADALGLLPKQVALVLRILGCIRPYRRSDSRFRFRGSTTRLSPGSVLVSDGKSIGVAMIGPNDLFEVNWQGTVDQATACHTAFVVTDEESADSLSDAHLQSCEQLGRYPLAIVVDNKPCYAPFQDPATLVSHLMEPTEVITATPDRPENKAVVEGTFGLFT